MREVSARRVHRHYGFGQMLIRLLTLGIVNKGTLEVTCGYCLGEFKFPFKNSDYYPMRKRCTNCQKINRLR